MIAQVEIFFCKSDNVHTCLNGGVHVLSEIWILVSCEVDAREAQNPK